QLTVTRRAIASLEDVFDAPEVEKYIVREFGSTTCIYERVCVHYAVRAQARPRPQLDWRNVFRNAECLLQSICGTNDARPVGGAGKNRL
ncbi:hypothetical protein EVAR_73871_1, partial [Eumeta japonica]